MYNRLIETIIIIIIIYSLRAIVPLSPASRQKAIPAKTFYARVKVDVRVQLWSQSYLGDAREGRADLQRKGFVCLWISRQVEE